MRQLIRGRLEDCSDREQFCFSLTCVECGRVWKSTPIRFSKAREQPLTGAKHIITQTLYQREHAQALERAVGEALEHFNACPLCGRLVCDHCFIICDDLDMCRSCTNYMQEKGEPVALEQPLKEVQYG